MNQQKRARIAWLVHSLKEFTEVELFDKYQNLYEPLEVDMCQAVRRYLKDLTQIGVLSYRNEVYHIKGGGVLQI